MTIAELNFRSKDYLVDSDKRIEHLREIVSGRPVAIFAGGPSIHELENRINELRHLDICYFGFNSFTQEKHILQQIDKQLSVFICGANESLPVILDEVRCFLNRDKDNMFVSSPFYDNLFKPIMDDDDLQQFLNDFDKKLLSVSVSLEKIVPNINQPLHFVIGNTLTTVIQLAIIGKASKIVLFGADGGCKEDVKEYYYRDYNLAEYETPPLSNLTHDTSIFFNPITPIAIRNTLKTYKISPIDILNCSEGSYYTPFPVISYDDAFEYLLSDKKFNLKSDLRIPRISVISLFVNAGDYLIETIESVLNQSYSNHEHIIVYSGEVSDTVKTIEKQYPYVRWVFIKDGNYLQAFKKGVSMARGDYISYCCVGDLYATPDWINTCVKILEHYPDISLVWGLSQYMSDDGSAGRIANAQLFDTPPPQGKEFIYYWLKEKGLYPESNLCVRKSVFKECFPLDSKDVIDEQESWVSFNYKFNTCGYIPYFISTVANYHRSSYCIGWDPRIKFFRNSYMPYYVLLKANSDEEIQESVVNKSWEAVINAYRNNINQYKKLLITRKIVHEYKSGDAKVVGSLDPYSYFSYHFKKFLKEKLQYKFVSSVRNLLRYGEKYHCGVIKRGILHPFCFFSRIFANQDIFRKS